MPSSALNRMRTNQERRHQFALHPRRALIPSSPHPEQYCTDLERSSSIRDSLNIESNPLVAFLLTTGQAFVCREQRLDGY